MSTDTLKNNNKQPADFVKTASQFLQQGHFAEAAGTMRTARRCFPDELGLFPLTLRSLMFLGEHDEVRGLLSQFEQRASGQPQYLGQCAELYAQCQLPGKAVPLYRTLSTSGNRDARYNLGANLLAIGELSEAKQVLEQLVAEHGTDGQAQQVLSSIRRVSADSNHVDHILAALQHPGLSVMDKVQLHYALGKEYEDLGDYSRAFEQFSAGAGLRRSGLRYRVDADVQTLAQICDQHGDLGSSVDATGVGDEAVFIFGLPRSGTTLVDRILSSHSQCDSFGEITDLPLALMVAAGKSLPKEELVRETARWEPEKISESYLRRLRTFGSSAAKHIDKTPLNFLYAGLIARAMPGATMIWMERHPMDACFAMYKTLFQMGYPFSYSFEDLAAYYIAYDKLKRRWQESLGDVIRFQSYETLVRDFDVQSHELVSAAGLDWEAACGEFHKNRSAVATASSSQVRQPLYKRAVGHWQNYADQLAPLAEALRAGGIEID